MNPAGGEATDLRKNIEDTAFRNFAELEKEILSDCGVEHEFKVEVGFVYNRVKHYAKKEAISMVVMGNTMNPSNKEAFDELKETMHVPLVIVP